MRAVLRTDGGARGNPGPAGFGVVLEDENGNVLDELAVPLGVQTNNFAEYRGLIAGLDLALRRGVEDIEVLTDSKLVVMQVRGEWKLRSDTLRPLAVRARALLERFRSATIRHVPRAHNEAADALANRAMDESELMAGPEPPDQGSLLGG